MVSLTVRCVPVATHHGIFNCVVCPCSYAYLTYKSPDEAKEAAEKYKDVEMDSKKLLVVHYGTYVEKPVKR